MSEEGEKGKVGTREVSMEGLVAGWGQLSRGEEMGLSDNRREMNRSTCLKAGRVLKCDSLRGSRVRGWGRDFSQGFVGPRLLLPAEYTGPGLRPLWVQIPVQRVSYSLNNLGRSHPHAKPQFPHQQKGLANLPQLQQTRDNICKLLTPGLSLREHSARGDFCHPSFLHTREAGFG